MIPLKIEIKNFLSYGPEAQTIDFQPYHLICLSGKNGHGKSALLDAITWAIWGHARKTTGTSKADEGLVHLGQKHMLVIIEFQVGQHTYKIRREYIKGQSKAFSTVEFGTIQEDGSIKSLTEKTIKTTQDIIERTLGITYEAFINSAFLRQGQSNEFSKKSSKERKEILAAILQLQEFDSLKNYALHAIKDLQHELLAKQSISQHLQKEQEQLANTPELFVQLEAAIQISSFQEEQFLQKKNNLEKNMQEYHQILQQQIAAKKQSDQIFQELTNSLEKVNALEKDLEETRKKLSMVDQRAQLEIIKCEYESQIKLYDEKLQQKLQLKEAYLHHKEQELLLQKQLEQEFLKQSQETNTKQQLLAQQIVFLQNSENDLQKNSALKDIDCKKLTDIYTNLEKEIATFDALKLTKSQKEFEMAHKKYQELQIKLQHLEPELQELLHKEKLVQQQDSCCPLCEQQISGSRKKFLHGKIETSLLNTQEQITQTNSKKQEIEAFIKSETKNIEILKNEHLLFTNLQNQFQEISHKKNHVFAEYDSLQKQIAQITIQIQTLQTECKIAEKSSIALQEKFLIMQAQNPQLQELQTIISGIIAQGKALSYQEAEHENLRKALQETLVKISQTASSELLYKEQIILQEKIIAAHAHIADLQAKLQGFPTPIQSSEKEEAVKTLEAEYALLNKEIETIKNTKQLQAQEKGKLQALLSKQESLTLHMKALEKEALNLEKEIGEYQEIARALGKDGIQALLIEEAIPEIEQEANDLLSRLTNNQTQIFIESLRDLKKGGHKETLDIKIADSFGLRPYEMFSGGEAFRIDFALRIAISKLLARRAGTTLQTLIIDEGFGSQDEEGLSLIMDSIYKIQDDFAKVIIVSHLPSLKEQFPVQFIVQKHATGSCIKIVEQG